MNPFAKTCESKTLPEGISRLRRLLVISLFSSISFLLMSYFEFPLLPAYPMFKYDASEVPALLVGFALGTPAGLSVVVLKDIIYLLLSGKGLNTFGLGIFMDLLAGLSMVFVATKIYFINPTKKFAVLGLISGTIAMTLVMLPLNYVVLSFLPILFPHLMDVFSGDKAFIYIYFGALPFNLLKGIITSFFTFVMYKKISSFLKDNNNLM